MNQRGASGSVERVAGNGALPKVIIRASDGASAEVYLQGAHITSWCPAPGKEEWLFLSARSQFRDGVAIRGGIPVIFPQFATEGPLPRHGFARTTQWAFVSEQEEADGTIAATFSLEQTPATLAVWPMSFRALLTVRVGGARLVVTFTVENTGSRPFDFTAALHSYFALDDVHNAEIVGLQNGRYRVSQTEMQFDEAETLRVSGEIDRVYVGAPSHLTLREPGRQLSIQRAKFPDVVVWNPGAEKAAQLADMEPGGSRRMLCIEAAAVQEPIEVRPGRSWWGSQTLIAHPREADVPVRTA
ncbi:MAG: D-hexose-6-phosphate mutarotase [bacterium]